MRKAVLLMVGLVIGFSIVAQAGSLSPYDLELRVVAPATVNQGEEFTVGIEARIPQYVADYGVANLEAWVTTPGTVGIVTPVEKPLPPNSGQVKTTFDSAIASNFTVMYPALKDSDGDGDMDAQGLAFSDMQAYSKTDVGNGWTLIATETWLATGAGSATLEITGTVNDRYFDWGVPSPYKSYFDNVTGSTTTVTVVPEPVTLSLLGFGLVGLLRRRKA